MAGTVTARGTSSDNVLVAKVEVAIDGGPYNLASGTTAWSWTWTTGNYSNGSHTLNARATDKSGNSKTSSVLTTVSNTVADTTAPTIVISSPAPGTTVSGTASVSGSASDNTGVARVEVAVDGGQYQLATGTSPWSWSWATTPTANGGHTVMARAIDTSGNVASASAAVTVSNPASDTTAPAVALTAPAPGAVVSGTVSVAGTAADNAAVAKVEVAIDGGPYQPASGTTNWSWSWNTAGATNANHVVTARSTDTSGNVGSSAMSVSVSNPAIGQHWVSPEGIVIDVNTAGPWTVNQIYSMLLQSGRDLDKVGPTLTIKVQDVYASSTAMAVGTADGRYTSASSTIYLKGVNSNFAANPDAVLAHEYGHAWSLYHLYLSQQGDWTSYLQARGIASDPRLDSTYNWDRREIIADDYRLLFGSAPAVSEMPNHLNPDLADPRNVPGLRDFLATAWSTPKP